MSPLERLLSESRAKGERVALATVIDGTRAGAQLLVWSAGHTFGDLGWPRLNQRVALYAEQLFERGITAASRKRFDLPGSPRTEISIELYGTE